MKYKLDEITRKDFHGGKKVFQAGIQTGKVEASDCSYLAASLLTLIYNNVENLPVDTKEVLNDAVGVLMQIE